MEMKSAFTGEIIGPSGAGKSTLSDLLNRMNSRIVAGITIWGLPRWILAKSSFISFPAFARMVIEDGTINVENGKQIIRLHAFYDYFRHTVFPDKGEENGKTAGSGSAFFLDEGVVFALSKMSTQRELYRESMKQWEENILDRWSQMLDTIVWLDAPNERLIERIRSRSKNHRMKYKSDQEIDEFLSRYRDAYFNTVARLEERAKLRILRFDTEERSLESIAEELTGLVEAGGKANETELAKKAKG